MIKEENRRLVFDQKDREFSYRVGALLYREGKLLMRKIKGAERYILPGGYPEWGENSKVALARCLLEQSGAAVMVGRLCILAELFFGIEKSRHQLQPIFLAELKNSNALPKETFPAYDSLGQPMEEEEFCWVEPERLEQAQVLPRCIRPYLKELPDYVIHLQDREERL